MILGLNLAERILDQFREISNKKSGARRIYHLIEPSFEVSIWASSFEL
jgi:hypothetical protein